MSKSEQRAAVGRGRLVTERRGPSRATFPQDGPSSNSAPGWGRLSPSLETEVEPVENPVDETTTVAGMLRREPQVFGAAPFSMAMGPERIWGRST